MYSLWIEYLSTLQIQSGFCKIISQKTPLHRNSCTQSNSRPSKSSLHCNWSIPKLYHGNSIPAEQYPDLGTWLPIPITHLPEIPASNQDWVLQNRHRCTASTIRSPPIFIWLYIYLLPNRHVLILVFFLIASCK